jgi:predicted nuclease with RNAse H fold
MHTLGVDLASAPRNTGLCLLEWRGPRARIAELGVGADDDDIMRLHTQADVTGIDCPFGWPRAFLTFLCHASRTPSEEHPAWSKERRDELRYRLTDFRTRELTGRFPLSVSSDLIALPAMRCAGLLARMGVLDRAGDGRVYETYPAAALHQWGLTSRGYRGEVGRPRREELVARLRQRTPWLAVSEEQKSRLVASADALDALVASLNARAAKLGLTLGPSEDERPLASREGWISVPQRGSLERLPSPAVA